MEDPGETGAHPLGAANLNFVPRHQQKEKLVKLGGQLVQRVRAVARGSGKGRIGGKPRTGKRQRRSPQTPAQVRVSAPRPSPDPLYDTPDASRAQAGRSQQPARTVSLRERLLITRPVWLQLRANAAAALHVLRTEPPGVSLSPSARTGPPSGGEGKRKRLNMEALSLLILFACRPSWYGNLTLASARLCVCGCQKPVAPLLSPATISKRALAVRGLAWREGAGDRRGREVPREQPHSRCLSGVSLEGSELTFQDLIQLICAYCHTR